MLVWNYLFQFFIILSDNSIFKLKKVSLVKFDWNALASMHCIIHVHYYFCHCPSDKKIKGIVYLFQPPLVIVVEIYPLMLSEVVSFLHLRGRVTNSSYKPSSSLLSDIFLDEPGKTKIQKNHFIFLVAPHNILLFYITVA